MKRNVLQKVQFLQTLFCSGKMQPDNNFKDFSTYALTCLIVPASNVIVEGIYSYYYYHN